MTAAEMDIVIGAEVTGAVNGLKQVQTQLVKSEQTATKFTQKSGKDFTGLSRVIQDLPFGFIAIQNNITQLLPAAGGLGLAVSAITAAVTFAQVGFSNWTRGLGATKEQIDEVGKSIAGAQTEITKVTALLAVTRDLTQSTATRTNALKELQKEYPGYLANVNLENINSQQASHAIDMLSQALVRKAKVQAISNLLTKAQEKLYAAQNGSIADNIVSLKSLMGIFKGGFNNTTGGIFSGAAAETASQIGDAAKEVDNLSQSLSQLTLEQSQGNDFSLLNPTTAKKVKENVEKIVDESKKLKPVADLFTGAIDFGRGIDIKPKNSMLIDVPAMIKNFQDGLKVVADFSSTLQSTVKGAITSAAEAIGAAFSGKGNIFSSFLGIIGNSLVQLGSYVIASVELLVGVKKALITALTETPFLGIAIGVGLIALGSVLKSIPKFASGGVVTSPTLALVGEQGPERITPLGYEGRAGSVMAGEVVFNISGQSLRGILKRADNTAYNTN